MALEVHGTAREPNMDPKRFDSATRALAGGASRRGVLRRIAAAAAALAVGRAAMMPEDAEARRCNYIGCACSTGTYNACSGGLVCCSTSGLMGGPGVCSYESDCGGQCADPGDYCGNSCNWGDSCPHCCSGYCGSDGSCGFAHCTGLGCACASGTYQPCDGGLVCCSSYPGMPGAQGTCQYSC
jgi:hypothetical protein